MHGNAGSGFLQLPSPACAVAVRSMTCGWLAIGRFRAQRSLYVVQEVYVLKGLDQITERYGPQRLLTRVLIGLQ